MLKSLTLSLFGLLTTCIFLGCGSEDDDLFGEYEVTDVDVIAKNIAVGEEVRVDIFFDTKTDLLDDPDDVEVVVSLPAALTFVEGSSEIFDNSEDERDDRDPDEVVECENGESFVLYHFGDSELDDRTLFDGGYGVRFEVVGATSAQVAEIEAAAEDNQDFGCNSSFAGEQNEVLTVE